MFVLSQKHTDLALGEIKALLGNDKDSRENPSDIQLYDYIAITNSNKQLNNRLAYTRFFYKFLFHCKESELISKISSFDWNKYYKYSFCIRKFGESNFSEREIADLVWPTLRNPAVDLTSPTTEFHFYFTSKGVLVGLLTSAGRKDFKERIPSARPNTFPSTMTPRFSACLINLSGIASGSVYDPMCGTGCILLEAAQMGFKIIGSDIDPVLLKMCRQNLAHFGFKGDIFIQDATKIKNKYQYIITDLPYGMHTKQEIELKKLYSSFLANLKKILRTRAVIIFPNFIRHKPLIKKAGLKLKEEYSYYLHKSLSRTICVLKP